MEGISSNSSGTTRTYSPSPTFPPAVAMMIGSVWSTARMVGLQVGEAVDGRRVQAEVTAHLPDGDLVPGLTDMRGELPFRSTEDILDIDLKWSVRTWKLSGEGRESVFENLLMRVPQPWKAGHSYRERFGVGDPPEGAFAALPLSAVRFSPDLNPGRHGEGGQALRGSLHRRGRGGRAATREARLPGVVRRRRHLAARQSRRRHAPLAEAPGEGRIGLAARRAQGP